MAKKKTPTKKPSVGKHPGGRPTKNIKDILPDNWKEIVLEKLNEGASKDEIRRALCNISGKFSLCLWYALEKRDKEFSETIKIGHCLSKGWWEEQGRLNLKTPGINSGLWFMNMKNRFPEDWKDKQEIDQSVEIVVNRKTFNGKG